MILRNFFACCVCASITFNAQAIITQPTTKPVEPLNVSTDIKPDDRQTFTNPAWFEISAKCIAYTQNQSVKFKLELKSGYAIINKKRYNAPHVIESFSVANKDKFTVQIGKQAKVALTLIQEGDTKKIKTDCSVSL